MGGRYGVLWVLFWGGCERTKVSEHSPSGLNLAGRSVAEPSGKRRLAPSTEAITLNCKVAIDCTLGLRLVRIEDSHEARVGT